MACRYSTQKPVPGGSLRRRFLCYLNLVELDLSALPISGHHEGRDLPQIDDPADLPKGRQIEGARHRSETLVVLTLGSRRDLQCQPLQVRSYDHATAISGRTANPRAFPPDAVQDAVRIGLLITTHCNAMPPSVLVICPPTGNSRSRTSRRDGSAVQNGHKRSIRKRGRSRRRSAEGDGWIRALADIGQFNFVNGGRNGS